MIREVHDELAKQPDMEPLHRPDTGLLCFRVVPEGLAAGRQDPVSLAAAWSRDELPRLLEWFWGWVADMIRLRSGAGAGTLTNPDQVERLQKLANDIESKELYRILDKVNETIRGLGAQLNLQMALEGLLLGWPASPATRSSNQYD